MMMMMRITESHLSLKKNEAFLAKLTDKLKTILSIDHWSVFTQHNNQIQEGLKTSTIQIQQTKLTKLRESSNKVRPNEDLNKQRWVKNLYRW